MVLCVALAAMGYVLLAPPPRLSAAAADGVYRNSCCGALVLKSGRGAHGDATFDYVIERDKMGPYVLPTSRLVTVDDESRLVIVQHEPALKLRLQAATEPQWIDIPDYGKTYRFVRQP